MTTMTIHHIQTPRISASRALARTLAADLPYELRDQDVELNARGTIKVTENFTRELAHILLVERTAGTIIVGGTVPGMYEGLKAYAEEISLPDAVKQNPLFRRFA
jgi:hypothetical protein